MTNFSSVAAFAYRRKTQATFIALAVLFAGPARAFYEPGASAAVLGVASGGAAARSADFASVNPAAAAFPRGSVSVRGDYRKFFAGIPAAGTNASAPGYISPDISEQNLEIFARTDSGVALGSGFYSLSLPSAFSNQTLAFYCAGSLRNLVYIDEGEDIVVGVSAKCVGVSYSPDEYTSDFFAKYSARKSVVTADVGAIYSAGRASFAFKAANLLPADVGIYERAVIPGKYVLAGALDLPPAEIRLDFVAEAQRGFCDVIPSAEINWGGVILRVGANSSQAAVGAGVIFADFSFDAAYVYPYGVAGGFGDFSAGVAYKLR